MIEEIRLGAPETVNLRVHVSSKVCVWFILVLLERIGISIELASVIDRNQSVDKRLVIPVKFGEFFVVAVQHHLCNPRKLCAFVRAKLTTFELGTAPVEFLHNLVVQ